MHTYAHECKCIGQHLKERLLWGTNKSSEKGKLKKQARKVSTTPEYTSFVPQILHKLLFLNAPGRTAYSLKHVKTMSHAKFGQQTQDLLWNLHIMKGREDGEICSL